MAFTTHADQPVLLAPSILASDFAELGAQCRAAAAAGADTLHVDVMDGMFVPNISIGLPIVAALRRAAILPLDCHLMIVQPERYVAEFAAAGAAHITVHAEATPHLHRAVEQIKAAGASAGVALNPATPLGALDEILPYVDTVLIMSVNPGFGGQRYIPTSTAKIARLRQILLERGLGRIGIQVDGGVAPDTVAAAVRAGATNLVVGSAIFNGKQSVAEAVAALRAALG